MPDNIVTFYHVAPATSSLRCLPVLVLVDDLPTPWLELLEITREKAVRFNRARFRVTHQAYGPTGRFEDMAQVARVGQRIKVFMICSAEPATGKQLSWPLFAGVICEGHGFLNGTDEGVQIVACDQLVYQNDRLVDGFRTYNANGESVYVRSASAVFNPDGGANRSATTSEINGRSYYVFEPNETKADYWSYADAIEYIACEYLSQDVIESLSVSGLSGLTRGQVLRDVDITGLDPLEAIERLCRRAGLGFCIVHAPDKEDVKEVLQFYRPGQGRKIFLRHQKAGESLGLGQTNLGGCSVNTVRSNETIRLIGRGDLKRFEATFELTKGWDPSLEINDYNLYSPATNDNFLEVRDVFRKWVLNEAGDYSDSPYNRGQAYDLSEVLGTDNYSRSRRRFWPCLSRSDTGKSLGYYLEISYDDAQTWQLYTGAFDNLLDECGVYLSSNQLDSNVWNAIKKGKLCFRITATIVGDERLEAILADGPIDSCRPVRTLAVGMGNEFKYRRVTAKSIFCNNTELGLPDEADDSEALRGQLRSRLEQIQAEKLSGKAELCWVHPDIWPGDVITEISGRNLGFQQITGRNSFAGSVEQVKIKLGNKWSTTISFGGS